MGTPPTTPPITPPGSAGPRGGGRESALPPGAGLGHLREERVSHLVARERHDQDDQHGGAREEPQAGDARDPAGGSHSLERDRGDEAQPHGEGRAGLAVGRDEGPQGEGRGPEAEESMDGQGHDEDEEEAEERPARRPGAGEPIDAGRAEEAPAGRDVEGGLELLDARRPADGGDRASEGEAGVGLEVQGRAPQLDAGRFRFGLRGDELVLSVDGDAAEGPGREEIQARRRAQRAAEAVADAGGPSVGIEPDLAGEGERVGRRLGFAPAHLLEREARARLDEERRQRAPLLGQLGPRGVDRRGAGDLDLPLGLVGGEDPHLARRPGVFRRLLREADRFRAALDARLDAHGVAAAAHLHAQGVLLDARRQVARDGHGDRARQDRSRERDLPRTARHLELEARLDEEGDAVLDVAEDLEPEALALALRLDAGPQPEEARLVAPRPGHGLAVEAQVHEADLGRHGQGFGQSRPGEAAGEAVAARAQAQARDALAVEDGGGRAVEADVLRPVLGVAREPRVDGAVGLQVEAEGAAARSQVEPQLAGPETDGLSLDRRAAEARHLIQHPRHPRAQARRQVVARDGLSARRRRAGGEGGGEDQPANDGRLEAAAHGHLPGPSLPARSGYG